MQMKQKQDSGWGNLYPKTIADNVELNDGRSLQDYKEEVDGRFPEQITLWDGEVILIGDDVVTPSKPLSDCSRGWWLIWKREGRAQQYQYTEIPKIALLFHSNGGTRAVLGTSGGVLLFKYFYVSNTSISGHDSNEDDPNGDISLIAVCES